MGASTRRACSWRPTPQASRERQRVPSLAHGRGVRRQSCLGINGLGLELGVLAAPSFSPGGARIEAMVADQVLSWRRDLGEDPGHVFHGVDVLGPCGTRVVATAFGEVQHLLGARQPLAAPPSLSAPQRALRRPFACGSGLRSQASQAHGRQHHVADQGPDTPPVAWRDVDGVVDRESVQPPRETRAWT